MKQFLIFLGVIFSLTCYLPAYASMTKDSGREINSNEPDDKKTKASSSFQLGPITIQKDSDIKEPDNVFSFNNPNDLAGEFIGNAFGWAGNMVESVIWISILFYLFILVAFLIIIILFFKNRNQREKRRQEILLKFIEKGETIPEYLIREEDGNKKMLNNGILWVAVGIGLLFLFPYVAPIPLFVGIAYFIIYFINRHDQ